MPGPLRTGPWQAEAEAAGERGRPMTQSDWLSSTDPQAMLAWICDGSDPCVACGGSGGDYGGCPACQGAGQTRPLGRRVSDRKLRLFAVACCRACSRLTHPLSLACLDAAERYADGLRPPWPAVEPSPVSFMA